MKVAGNLIKNRRLNYGMSQRELASGICAQATVSLIETQDSCPNLEILHPICHRLSLTIKTVIRLTKGVRDVEVAVLKSKYQQAAKIFKRIPKRNFRIHHHLACYFCYKGIFSLSDKSYLDALYYFNKVINVNDPYHDRFYQAWANLGLGIIYFKRNDYEKALEFSQIADQQFDYPLSQKSKDRFQLFISLRLRLSSLLGALEKFQLTNDANFKTIIILVKSHSMYGLAEAYHQLNHGYLKLNRYSQADLALKRARLFHKLYLNPKSLLD